MPPSDPPLSNKTRATLVAYLPLIAVIFGAGGAAASLTHVLARADAIETRLDAHERLGLHADAERKIGLIEQRQAVAEEQIREMRSDAKDYARTQNKILRRLDAMCAAMPRCKKDAP